MRLIQSMRFAALTTAGLLVVGACAQSTTRPVTALDKTAVSNAVTYLAGQQQADGGFELAGFPGFETPDAIAAIAANANIDSLSIPTTTSTPPGEAPRPLADFERAWQPANARAAVVAVKTAGNKTPLDAVDDFAEGAISAGQAAKLIVLVSEPLGYDSGSFDPAGDGAAKNLVGTMLGAYNGNGTFGPAGSFNVTLYSALASKLALGSIPKATPGAILAAQRTDGGWNYLGNPADATASDVDTTALAVQALVAALPDGTAAWVNENPNATQTAILKALGFLASKLQATGGVGTGTAADPNSTAAAILAIRSVGFNPAQPCWRNVAAPTTKGTAYIALNDWLRTQQLATGRVQSPNDSFGVNTFATSQAAQALALSWLPIADRPLVVCTPANITP